MGLYWAFLALCLFQESMSYEVVSRRFPHQRYFYCDTCSIPTHDPCVMGPPRLTTTQRHHYLNKYLRDRISCVPFFAHRASYLFHLSVFLSVQCVQIHHQKHRKNRDQSSRARVEVQIHSKEERTNFPTQLRCLSPSFFRYCFWISFLRKRLCFKFS